MLNTVSLNDFIAYWCEDEHKKTPSEHHLTFHHHHHPQACSLVRYSSSSRSSFMTFHLLLGSTQAQWIQVMGRWIVGTFEISHPKGSKQGDNQEKHEWVQLAGLAADEKMAHRYSISSAKGMKGKQGFYVSVFLPYSMAQWWGDQWERMRSDGRRRKREERKVMCTTP